jgi:hypothetical protein
VQFLEVLHLLVHNSIGLLQELDEFFLGWPSSSLSLPLSLSSALDHEACGRVKDGGLLVDI